MIVFGWIAMLVSLTLFVYSLLSVVTDPDYTVTKDKETMGWKRVALTPQAKKLRFVAFVLLSLAPLMFSVAYLIGVR